MLTVGDLRDILKYYNQDAPVILSKDAEGNGYSPLSEAGDSYYEAANTWSGYTYATPEFINSEEGKKQGFTEEDLPPETAIPVVVLWPIN